MRQPTRRARQTATIRREREDQFNGWLADAMIATLRNFPFPPCCRPPARRHRRHQVAARCLSVPAGQSISAGGGVVLLPASASKAKNPSRGKRRDTLHCSFMLFASLCSPSLFQHQLPCHSIPIPPCFPRPPNSSPLGCCCVRPRHFYFRAQEQVLLRLPPRR